MLKIIHIVAICAEGDDVESYNEEHLEELKDLRDQKISPNHKDKKTFVEILIKSL